MVRQITTAALFILLACLAALPAAAAAPPGAPRNFVDTVATPDATSGAVRLKAPVTDPAAKAAIGPFPGFLPPPPLDPTVAWVEQWLCRNAGPAEWTGFRVQCVNATFLDFHIADCCVPGDHWQLKGKAWDVAPNTGVTTSPGPANAWSVAGRAYNYGGTPFFPGGLDAYVECTYLNGVNLFLADSFVFFSSDGLCTVTPDPSVQRIDRTP